MYKSRIVIGLLVGLFPSVAFAQTAGMLSVQGYLKQGDQPVPDNIDVEFRIYDQSTGGNLVDMDGDAQICPTIPGECNVGQDAKQALNVPVSLSGVFATKFGPVSPKSFDGSARYLEISVRPTGGGSFAILSRTEMATAPATAERVNVESSGNPAIFAITNSANPEGVVSIGPGSPSTSPRIYVGTGDGTLASRVSIQDSSSFANGIKLDLLRIGAGDVGLNLTQTGIGSFGIVNPAGTSDLAFCYDRYFGSTGTEMMRLKQGGKVGIGTSNPTATLHVGGEPGVDGIKFPDGTLQTTASNGPYIDNLIATHATDHTHASVSFNDVFDSSKTMTLPSGTAVISWSLRAYPGRLKDVDIT